MTYTIIAFVTRSSTLTVQEFKTYYEHKHIPLLFHLVGKDVPIEFKRRYFARANRKGFGGPANPDQPLLTLRGDVQGLDCDCITELTFEDEAHFQRFYKKIYEKDIAAKLAEDENVFIGPDLTKVIVVSETWSTNTNGDTTSEVHVSTRSEASDGEITDGN